jgi:3-dehydroquinate dehydratase-2
VNVLFLFGPNLGALGAREPERYGTETLEEIMRGVSERAGALGHTVTWRQSDAEGDLLGWIRGAAGEEFDAIVVNPAALSHYSYALRDAIAACGLPVVEVHMTNIHAREGFRRTSVVSPVARVVIAGAGAGSYHLALEALAWITR